MITNGGKKLWASAIGNLNNGYTGTVKEIKTTTTLVAAGGPKWAEEQFVGQDVFAGGFVGTILSNTETVLTVARWEKLPSHEHEAFNRAEEAPEPPAGSSAFYIASGTTPAAWVAVSADKAAPEASNETLKGEIGVGKTESSKFGLVRKLAKFTYLGGKEYKVEVTFTAGTEDAPPVSLAKIGVFNAQNGGTLMFESLLTAEAEIKAVGDSVTISDVVTGS